MPRVYAAEDGNLSTSIIVARSDTYTDLSIDFLNKPTNASGLLGENVKTDVRVVLDAAAVKQSIKNILLTGRGEKPFMPMYGTNLQYLLFELDTDFDDDLLQDEIIETLSVFEPRCEVQKIRTEINGDQHSVKCLIEFKVVNSATSAIVEIDIARMR